jgi:predicted GNAT family acetyltransferase
MLRFYPILLTGVFILFLVCTKTTAFGKELYEAPSSEHKVKDAMTIMQEDLDNLEDAVLKDDFKQAVRLSNEIDEANHYVCNLDLSRTELSKQEQNKFNQLRNDMHKQTHALRLAVDKGSPDMVLEESHKLRETCENCHQVFKKK